MSFKILEIPEVISANMKSKGIWRRECPVSIENLRLLEVEHIDFDGLLKAGQMIVHHKIAENAIAIFRKLLKLKFPIHKMRLIDEYEGSDEMSMEDNNSSAFNFRNIVGSEVISMHSYGLAIDINPLQNPYLVIDPGSNNVTVYPKEGSLFLNRRNLRPGMLEPVVPIFTAHGLEVWGGNWNSPIDYHHFQIHRDRVEGFIK